jgi:hypothetical protein
MPRGPLVALGGEQFAADLVGRATWRRHAHPEDRAPGLRHGGDAIVASPSTWLRFTPLQIKGVTFGDGSTPQHWSAPTAPSPSAVTTPGTTKDYGQALQFDQETDCLSPDGSFAQYCSTILR